MSIRSNEEIETKPTVSTWQAFQHILETGHSTVVRKLNGRIPAATVRSRNDKQCVILHLFVYRLPTDPEQGLNVLQREGPPTFFQIFLADLLTSQKRQGASRRGIGTLCYPYRLSQQIRGSLCLSGRGVAAHAGCALAHDQDAETTDTDAV